MWCARPSLGGWLLGLWAFAGCGDFQPPGGDGAPSYDESGGVVGRRCADLVNFEAPGPQPIACCGQGLRGMQVVRDGRAACGEGALSVELSLEPNDQTRAAGGVLIGPLPEAAAPNMETDQALRLLLQPEDPDAPLRIEVIERRGSDPPRARTAFEGRPPAQRWLVIGHRVTREAGPLWLGLRFVATERPWRGSVRIDEIESRRRDPDLSPTWRSFAETDCGARFDFEQAGEGTLMGARYACDDASQSFVAPSGQYDTCGGHTLRIERLPDPVCADDGLLTLPLDAEDDLRALAVMDHEVSASVRFDGLVPLAGERVEMLALFADGTRERLAGRPVETLFTWHRLVGVLTRRPTRPVAVGLRFQPGSAGWQGQIHVDDVQIVWPPLSTGP